MALDYRIKSVQSSVLKYHRYYPDHQARKVFDDLLGFRSLCDNYEDVLALHEIPELRVADMSQGKANDDGYRGIHVYYQLDGHHYPIEIQYNTYYDRQFNNWLHKYIYKYLKYLLEQRPSLKWSDEQLEKLAPWSNEVKQLCNNN